MYHRKVHVDGTILEVYVPAAAFLSMPLVVFSVTAILAEDTFGFVFYMVLVCLNGIILVITWVKYWKDVWTWQWFVLREYPPECLKRHYYPKSQRPPEDMVIIYEDSNTGYCQHTHYERGLSFPTKKSWFDPSKGFWEHTLCKHGSSVDLPTPSKSACEIQQQSDSEPRLCDVCARTGGCLIAYENDCGHVKFCEDCIGPARAYLKKCPDCSHFYRIPFFRSRNISL